MTAEGVRDLRRGKRRNTGPRSFEEGGAGQRRTCAVTSNLGLRPVLGNRSATKVAERPRELSEIEKLLYPAWLDHDSASVGPSYLGYVMLLLIVALPVELGVLAALLVATS